jgi:hypothetical protein
MDNVIYFPYIRVPKSRWFTQVLLYWDQIGSIVPTGYVNNRGLLGRYMHELVKYELVRQIRPANYIGQINEFGHAFLEYVESDKYPIPKQMRKREYHHTINVHMEKLDFIGQKLCEKGLAWKKIIFIMKSNHIRQICIWHI